MIPGLFLRGAAGCELVPLLYQQKVVRFGLALKAACPVPKTGLYGAVVQLEAHRTDDPEITGSIPVCSTR